MRDGRKTSAFRARIAQVWDVRPQRVDELLSGVRTSSARVNALHPGGVDVITRELYRLVPDAEEIEWAENCYLIGDALPALVPLLHEGKVYLQNASSLIPPVALDPQPGDRVLDVSAAPGGKAFHLAARMGGDGHLWLNDNVKPRLDKMRDLAITFSVPVETFSMHPAQYLDKELPGEAESFDRILLDVQCSGEGRVDLRRADALKHWSEERITKYLYLQTKMLDAAYKLLRPGGVMVYSTCTISPEENEAPVARVLSRHDDLNVVPMGFTDAAFRPGLLRWRDLRFAEQLRHAVRVMPTPDYEGFFAAKIVRKTL